jgi:SAM-dependent methyltransferase
MDSDRDWQDWGRHDPYFAVLTQPRFRRGRMDSASREAFFEDGRLYGEHLINQLRNNFDPTFAPRHILDFGCGVGRVLIPWLGLPSVESATAIDVSGDMLDVLRQHCPDEQRRKLNLVQSPAGPAAVDGLYDLVHCSIVLQHITEARGQLFLGDLLDRIAPGGMAAVQCMYGRGDMPHRFGRVSPWWTRLVAGLVGVRRWVLKLLPRKLFDRYRIDPALQMHAYDVNRVFYEVHRRGLGPIVVEFVNHGGALGYIMYVHRHDKPSAIDAPSRASDL